MSELLKNSSFKVGKYTGKMSVEERKLADQKFLLGDLAVLVVTESFELGVDNPNINQVVRIGCPRNLGVLLQEVGRAGRQKDSVANGLLLCNEYIDDKRLGLWLKSALDCRDKSSSDLERTKHEMIANYTKAWRFIYSLYHGKCLVWALSHFYAGTDDQDPKTCFVANNPQCMVCEEAEAICQESIDIQQYMVLLLKTLQSLADNGLQGITKTLIIAILMQSNEQYVRKFKELECVFDDDDDDNDHTLRWGCGRMVGDVQMSMAAWHKVLYVAVHIGYVDMFFDFRPFDCHYEVHRKYFITSDGKEFISSLCALVSLDPHSSLTNMMLGLSMHCTNKRVNQKRGMHLKPKIIDLLQKTAVSGTIEQIKYIGFAKECKNVYVYFENIFTIKESAKDPHFLLNCIQLSRSQVSITEITVKLDEKFTTLKINRAYCSGVKVCGGEGCTYTVSTKQRVNRCTEHTTMALIPSGPCNCHLVYVYPLDDKNDGRRWVIAINSEGKGKLHNHAAPAEWKIPPNVLEDISNTAMKNASITPKEVQKGKGMSYQPINVSMAAANIDRVRAVVKRARKDVEKVDNEKVNPFKVVASFPSIKQSIDGDTGDLPLVSTINTLMGKYQLDGDNAYIFGRDRQYAFFQAPFQAYEWSRAEVLFIDIDYTGCHHFKYLLNIVCLNSVTKKYMACGRALLNHQDGCSIGTALSVLTSNVKNHEPTYDIRKAHKEILLDFDDAEANAFQESFGNTVMSLIRGCSVHFMRSAMRVAKVVNSSSVSTGYSVFMAIAKRIPD